jgi:Holliday junction resolvase
MVQVSDRDYKRIRPGQTVELERTISNELDGRGVVVVREMGSPKTRVQRVAAGVSALGFSLNVKLLAVGTDKGEIILLSVGL